MQELLTPMEMAEADRLAIAGGISGMELMQVAGSGVADVVMGAWPRSTPERVTRVLVLAGPGNNGGDGFVAGRILAGKGYAVSVALLGRADRLRGDAKLAFDAMGDALIAGLTLAEPPLVSQCVTECDVIVDALFGAGLARDLDGDAAQLVEALNASGKPVVAVDLPSGVDGETGAVRGVAVRAAHTVTFFRRKPGHLLYPGRDLAGCQHLVDIGTPVSVLEAIKPQTFVNDPALWRGHWQPPAALSHKYQRGHAVVASGPTHATGAARLAATAALRAGAGLVTLASTRDAVVVNAAHLTAVMIRPVGDEREFSEMLADPRVTAVAIGPGFGVGERTCAYVAAALERHAGPKRHVCVLDADALTSFEGNPGALFEAIAASASGRSCLAVLTPHDGEFARLFPELMALPSRLQRARAAARVSGAVVVLKGADSVIAAPDGRAAINENASPWLATAGAGDVLSGLVCGFCAQRMPAFEAACMAVWCHGAAADECGPGLIAEDLVPAMRPVIARLSRDCLSRTADAP